VPTTLTELITDEQRRALKPDARGFSSFIADADRPASQRSESHFDGWYGGFYDRVVMNPRLRRIIGLSLWGREAAIRHLDAIIDALIATLPEHDGIVIDLPAGGGTALPLFAERQSTATIVECDLSATMLERAIARWTSEARGVNALFVRCDAYDLPFAEQCADAVVSFNGLHCMPSHDGFLTSLRRLLRPGASAFITTMVATRSPRHRAVAAIARRMGVLPGPLPTHDEIVALAKAAGFASCASLGGRGIEAFQLTA